MESSPISAAQFYASAKPATKPQISQEEAGGGLTQAVSDFASTLKQGEDTAKAAMTGNADLPTLVEALAKSELAVETAVTVRDKVVEAYQEILRMPV